MNRTQAPTGQLAADRKPELRSEIHRLSLETEALEEQLSILSNRLSPILRMEEVAPELPDTKPYRSATTEIGHELSVASGRIVSLAGQVSRLIQLLEV
jgi:hypothetical protein